MYGGLMKIRDIPEDKRLRQLAEECAECSQAALKLIRAYEGEAQLSKANCRIHLLEEIADVAVCAGAIMTDLDRAVFDEYCDEKQKRWEERLKNGSKS